MCMLVCAWVKQNEPVRHVFMINYKTHQHSEKMCCVSISLSLSLSVSVAVSVSISVFFFVSHYVCVRVLAPQLPAMQMTPPPPSFPTPKMQRQQLMCTVAKGGKKSETGKEKEEEVIFSNM